MNAPFHKGQTEAQPGAPSSMPSELEALAPPPLLLPGESLQRYQLMRQAILIELAPRSAIEWLLAIDVVDVLGNPALPSVAAQAAGALSPTRD